MANPDLSLDLEESDFPEPNSRLRVMLGLGILTALVIGVALVIRSQNLAKIPPPEEQLEIALKLLKFPDEPEAWRKAARISRNLQESSYLPPESAGMLDYIRGISAFRRAEAADELQAKEIYPEARDHLIQAELNAIQNEARPEWAFALGVTLYHLNELRSQQLLNEALESFPRERGRIVELLINLALETNRENELANLLTLNQELIDTPGLTTVQKSPLWRKQSELLLRLGKVSEAVIARKQIDRGLLGKEEEIVFHSRVHIAERSFQKAEQLLQPLSRKPGLEQKYPRQASYLLGVADLLQDQTEQALEHFDETLRRFPETPESLAATMKAARILQNLKRDEEALQLFEVALRELDDPENFRNSWIGLEEIRAICTEAWNEWIQRESWKQAVELAKKLTPLLPQEDALSLEAQANQKWAEWLEKEYPSIVEGKQQAWKQQIYEQWKQSGESWKALSDVLHRSSTFKQAVWNSAEHFLKAHRYVEAEEQLIRFLDSDDSERKATALVRLGQVLLSLNRIDEAASHFQRVIAEFSTSPIVFEAQLWRGKSLVEQDRIEAALKVWQEMIQSDLLSPAAREWQQAIFELGRLHFYLAEKQLLNVEVPGVEDGGEPLTEEELAKLRQESFTHLEEARKALSEVQRRYPESAQAGETRYLLARTLQLSTIQPRNQQKVAETENARKELKRQIDELYQLALAEFEILESTLTKKSESTALDVLEKQLLRNATFELGHTQYALGNYENALAAYQRALNRYPVDEHIYLLYLQMADVYDQLQQPVEAQNMLEQAKIILRQANEDALPDSPDRLNQNEWRDWLNRMRQFYGKKTL